MSAIYDLVLTHSGTPYSYMLRQEGKTKDWLVTDSPLLPQTLITESASPSNINPDREIQVSQVDWRKGFQDFMLEDEYKYYESENCDARLKGEVTLSPKKLSALSWESAPSTPTVTDGGLEAWGGATTPSYWTVDSGTFNRYSQNGIGPPHGGTYAGEWYNGGNDGSISQEIISSGNIANYKGMLFKAKCYNRTTDKANCTVKIGFNDGDSSTDSSGAISANNTWEAETVYHRVSYDATKLDIVITGDSSSGKYAMVDDITLELYPEDATGAVVKIIEFGDTIVGAVGKNLYSIGSSSTEIIATFEYDITDLSVFKNRLYIAQGWSNAYYYTSDLSTFTESNLSNNTAKYMSNVGSSQFWIADSENTMRDSDNPINGGTAFSSEYTVGSSDWEITGLVDHEDTVFVRKEDDLYYLSGSDVLSLMDIDSEASTTYTYGLHLWGDCLYIGSGVNSLYEYDIGSSTATTISPVRYAPGDANYDEEILSMCHDESYLYIAIDNGSDIKILAGRWETVDGETDWYWHPLYDKTMNDITAMLISSNSGSKRLYIGTDTYSDGIIPFIVSVAYSQPYTESGYECESSGTFYTSWYRSNFPTEEKYWKSIDITSICCTDKTSITPHYQVKGGTWTALAACTTSAYSGGYPDETTDSIDIGVTSERIRFKFVMAATDDDYTPILYGTGGGIVTYAVLQSDKKRQIQATIRLAPQIRLRDEETVENRNMADDLTNLRTLYQSGEEITVTGPDETAYTCVFAREGYNEQLAYDETNRIENWWCTLKLLEV